MTLVQHYTKSTMICGFQSNFQSAKRPAAHMTGLKQVNPSGGCWPNRPPNSSTSSSYLRPKQIKVAKWELLWRVTQGDLVHQQRTCIKVSCSNWSRKHVRHVKQDMWLFHMLSPSPRTNEMEESKPCCTSIEGTQTWRKFSKSSRIRGLQFGAPGTRIRALRG